MHPFFLQKTQSSAGEEDPLTAKVKDKDDGEVAMMVDV